MKTLNTGNKKKLDSKFDVKSKISFTPSYRLMFHLNVFNPWIIILGQLPENWREGLVVQVFKHSFYISSYLL